MKKTILIVVLMIAALAVVGVGTVFAQDVTPPVGGRGAHDGSGPLHTFLVTEFAKKLNLNVNDINTRLAAGERLYDIALSAGVVAEEFPAIIAEVRTNAVNAAVAANVITQEQADWMLSHGFGRGGGMRGNGTGNCDGTGLQGQGNGHGMMGQGRGAQNQQANP